MFDVAEISELQSKVLIRLIDDDKDFLKSLGLLLKMTGWSISTYHSAVDFCPRRALLHPGVSF